MLIGAIYDFDRRLTKINDTTIYNLDVARNQYIEDSKQAYMRGCLNGSFNYKRDDETLNAMDWCGGRKGYVHRLHYGAG